LARDILTDLRDLLPRTCDMVAKVRHVIWNFNLVTMKMTSFTKSQIT
jgi:hypothetical protein